MKKLFALVCLASLVIYTNSIYAVEADDVLGVWKTAPSENGYSHVEIYKARDELHGRVRYFGKLVYLSNPTYTEQEAQKNKHISAGEIRRDHFNPDKSKREREIQGLILVRDFSFTGKQWKGGRIYDPESGKTYKAKMWLNKNGSLGLRGYVGISAFGRSTIWTRVENETESESVKVPENTELTRVSD